MRAIALYPPHLQAEQRLRALAAAQAEQQRLVTELQLTRLREAEAEVAAEALRAEVARLTEVVQGTRHTAGTELS